MNLAEDLGNITSKSDVGAYTYAAAGSFRPHAVTGAGSNTYAYDANGNMTSGAGRTITWTAFNKVASMTQGTTNLSWTYGPERQRIKQVSTAGDTYYYSGGPALFEKLVGPTVTQWNHYLFAGGEMVGVHFTRSDATEMIRWFVKDHLGSVAVLTATTSGTGIVSRATSATYETNGRFALTRANALGHTESVVSDAKFDVPTSQTGPNGLSSSWTNNSFGRFYAPRSWINVPAVNNKRPVPLRGPQSNIRHDFLPERLWQYTCCAANVSELWAFQ